MNIKKLMYSLSAVVFCLFAFSQAALAYSSAYGSQVAAPTLYAKSTSYSTAYFPIVGSPPASSKVGLVSYSWSYSYIPAGLEVWLCHAVVGCLNVTNSQSGSTTAFQSAGASAASQFYLATRVTGSGTMAPAYGQVSRVTVNYTY
jgi:hypothetical protein